MTQIKPLQVKNYLAGHQNQKPQFAVKVQLNSGAEIQLADPKATRALVALMDMYAVLGGAASHYGGPAALAELMSALHGFVFSQAESLGKNWFDLAHIVNDAGHCENGLYALKANYQMAGLKLNDLKKFRSIESGLTGHGEVHCFKEGVFLSNGPLGSAFPQSQGLALAEKLSGTNRTTYCVLSDGAGMEGEAKEALAAIPGLAAKGLLAPYILIITDNNTKLSGRIDQDSFSMQPTFNSMQELGWSIHKVLLGNDLQTCMTAIENATEEAQKNPLKPVVIWAKTTKGIGTKKTADSASGGHGFPCKSPTELNEFINEIYSSSKTETNINHNLNQWPNSVATKGGSDSANLTPSTPVPVVFTEWIQELIQIENKLKSQTIVDSGEKIQIGVSKALIKAAKKGLPIVSVTSDLPGSTGVAGFRKEFPHSSFDVGVAESNMISTAAGLSKIGFIPVVDTFAQFGVTKGALPLTMAMLSEAPVIGVFSHTGFQDAADGASHQALSYMSMLASIPGIDLYSLSSSEEAEYLVFEVLEKFALDRIAGLKTNTSIFFLGRENFPKSYLTSTLEDKNKFYQFGGPQILFNSVNNDQKPTVIISTGSLVGEALKAANILKAKNQSVIVVNQPRLNSFNKNFYKDLIQISNGHFVIVEDHQVILGFGAFLSSQLVQELGDYKLKIKCLGVQGEFGQSAYNAIELYKKHGIDSDSIVQTCQQLG